MSRRRRLTAEQIAAAHRSRLLQWTYRGQSFASRIIASCNLCGTNLSVVELPAAVLAEQPDDTTHVCHPLLGGCNHGYALATTTSPAVRGRA